MSESKWRQRSAIVIAGVLKGLPPTATLKEKRDAIRAAYPFGPRDCHPYKMWLKEVAAALSTPQEKRRAVVSVGPLGVICGWCDGRKCFGCLGARVQCEEVMTRPEWLGFWRQIDTGNIAARIALTDWLKEQGLEELANLI